MCVNDRMCSCDLRVIKGKIKRKQVLYKPKIGKDQPLTFSVLQEYLHMTKSKEMYHQYDIISIISA